MKTTYGISTAALLAFVLSGISARAQESVAPATAATPEDVVATTPPTPAATVSANSKIRIVRLSESKGEVQLDRETGKGFEAAMANLPIIEGARLKTATGVAEVEFEDNSTLRVGPDSMIEFTQLELTPSGVKVSGVHVLEGTVYVNLMKTKDNQFTLTAGKEKIDLPPDSHIRLQLTQDQAEIAVLHGDATVEGSTGATQVSKNKTMSFSPAGQGEPVIARSVTEGPLDGWDSQAVQYHNSFANATAYGNAPYSYGINDLNYYGSFSSGCGVSMWRPYFAGANFDPYGSGAWAYYQNTGYSWVSPYPWGWTPYHYGSWAFCQGVGWGWQPGGTWMGLANNSFASAPGRPRPPSHAPLHSSLVPVNLGSAPASGLVKGDKFVFRNGSAGLGVPRGTLGKLDHFSGHAMQHGEATAHMYSLSEQRSESQSGAVGHAQGASVSSASHSSLSSGVQSAGGGHAPSGAGGGGGGHK